MKIGVDLRVLQVGHEFRGIGAHVRSLLEAMLLDPGFTQNEIFFYQYDSTNPLETIRVPKELKYEVIKIKNPKDPRENKTKQDKAIAFIKEIIVNHFALNPVPETSKLDTFIQFDQALGLPRNPFVRKVLFVYDFIPLAFKSDYLPSPLSIYRKHGWRAALRTHALNLRYKIGVKTIKRANKILVPSEFTGKDASNFLGIKSKKIVVAPCALPTIALKKPVDLKKSKKENNVGAKKKIVDTIIDESKDIPYLLYVGGVEAPRRRLDDLVGAYHQLRASGVCVRLVLVGRELGSVKTIPDPNTALQLAHDSYKDDLFMMGYLDDKEVDRLYHHTKAFVFVSLYEGFGLPILESYAKGCPVITYDNSSISEVAGDAAIYCEPTLRSLTDTLEKVVKDEITIDEKRMKTQLEKFSWVDSAKIVTKTILGN
ncbi:hypothetical protein A3F64_00085 [Candidatus Saccharibacteria bacterium RIFCSPHIGHO2_12_FULL_42_8]|nr:MAG: hypothetical protein A3F64_00085 [Candidatus Saccharibacteria bacterium RIFCSPHIGHO2_12_FULL_42_8]